MIGAGTVCYLCNLVDTLHIDIIVVVSEPIGGLELKVFSDNKIDVITAPTPDELVRAINKKHSLTNDALDTQNKSPAQCRAFFVTSRNGVNHRSW